MKQTAIRIREIEQSTKRIVTCIEKKMNSKTQDLPEKDFIDKSISLLEMYVGLQAKFEKSLKEIAITSVEELPQSDFLNIADPISDCQIGLFASSAPFNTQL